MIKRVLLSLAAGAALSVSAAEPYTLPFNFPASQENFGECLTFDLNGDEESGKDNGIWSFDQTNTAFRYYYHGKNQANDWLILPLVDCGEATKVKISVSVKTGSYNESFEVKIGQERTPGEMTVAVLSETNFVSEVKKVLSAEIELPAATDGNNSWAIGIHAVSEADKYFIDITDVSIEDASQAPSVPVAPVIKSSSVEGYQYTATIAMPDKTVDGEDLTDAMSLVVSVDGTVVETKTDCAPGAEVEVSQLLTSGEHVIGYKAVAGSLESATVEDNVNVERATGNYTLPFVFEASQESFDECLTFDVNGDKLTYDPNDTKNGIWSYNMNYQAFKYTFNSNNDADDWIILPLVDFGNSIKVKVSLDVRTEYDSENFEVYLGRERTVDGMNLLVLEKTGYIHKGSFETLSSEVDIPEIYEGEIHNRWCIGVHASSPSNHYNLYVNNFRIESLETTGVESVEVEANAPVEYFNLQGMPITNPASGQVVVVRRGAKTYKTVVR